MTLHESTTSVTESMVTNKHCLFIYNSPLEDQLTLLVFLNGDPGGYSASNPRSYNGFAIESRYNWVFF
jgi:hypothetical protein